MIELMTVITIIVLMLAVAVPLVRTIQGNRTTEVGYNTIAAALGHARQIALYYRAPAGVAFYKDPASGLQTIAYVMQEKNIPQDVALNLTPLDDRYVDVIPGEQLTTLPQGLAVQVCNGNGANISVNNPEKYLRVGVVMFDEDGQLATIPYWIRAFSPGYHLGNLVQVSSPNGLNPPTATTGGATPPALYTHSTICLYDEESFLNQSGFADLNSVSVNYFGYYAGGQTDGNKSAEQLWLDQNAEILVIRPNDGSLLRNK